MSKTRKTKIDLLKSKLPSSDIFICCSSFEHRCLCIPERIKTKEIPYIIIFENESGSKRIKDNTKKISELFAPEKTTIIKHNFSDSLRLADSLVTVINHIKGNELRVIVDISTFTHEVLLLCLKILNNSKKIRSILCVYLNAKEYCPNTERNKKWLSHGCKDVHSVLGFPGMLFPSQKTHLILIVGYEYSRAFDAISILEPNSITLLYGCPESSTTSKDKEANGFFMDLVRQMAFEYKDIECSKVVKCDDPQNVCDILQDLFGRHEGDNIIVVPMNNKLSTVGVAMASFHNENVQICYAPAIDYNEDNYSLSGDDCYYFKLK